MRRESKNDNKEKGYMKYAVKRKGFHPAAVERLARQSDHAIWAVLCLANESCAIGDEYPSTLRNYLTRSFRKYARIYGVFVDLRTGEVIPRSSINRRYGNRLSYEVRDFEVKCEILRQLGSRFWWYLTETGLKLWIAELEEDVEKILKEP
jgi:lambda repressor-like predicted transcriptional regulator